MHGHQIMHHAVQEDVRIGKAVPIDVHGRHTDDDRCGPIWLGVIPM
jgi:hypothetical protein